MSVLHEWVVRAKCQCGYIWTTPGSSSVACRCGLSGIEDGNLIGDAAEVVDEQEFTQAVADDISCLLSELILIKA